jgi:hypothetical protein
MQYFKISLWSFLLVVSFSAPGAAQQALADPAEAGLQCGEYYACIDSRPLSEAEARSSRGYPPPSPPQAEIASRDTKAFSDTRSKGLPAPMDLSARQLPPATAF